MNDASCPRPTINFFTFEHRKKIPNTAIGEQPRMHKLAIGVIAKGDVRVSNVIYRFNNNLERN